MVSPCCCHVASQDGLARRHSTNSEFSKLPRLIALESILLPYQREWIADRAPVKVYEKSRRIGITWAESADAALDAGTRKGSDWWYIGYNKEMALEFVEAAAGWAQRFNHAVRRTEQI